MFIPAHFKNENIEEIREFVRQNSFATLVSLLDEKLWATHIPIELECTEDGVYTLQGHISKANPQCKIFTEGASVLAIFLGAHTYISSSWYRHENVPTWNYSAVHIYGTVKVLDNEKLFQHLNHLVDKYETSSENPISINSLSKDYVKKSIRGLVGFEITITEIQAAKKLSQNRNAADYENIISELEKRDDDNSHHVAAAMIQIKNG